MKYLSSIVVYNITWIVLLCVTWSVSGEDPFVPSDSSGDHGAGRE